MPPRRSSLELTVEHEAEGPGGASRRYRLSATYELPPGALPPTAEELRALYESLDAELSSALPNAVLGPRNRGTDRSLEELLETYRPRQPELPELLLSEGEITPGEFERLRRHLAEAAVVRPLEIAPMERPIAAAPLAQDRTPAVARPVEELVRLYHIESLKQAGAVRGRRQISYEEYMALKRHFQREEPPTEPALPPDVRS